jgi:hypothetical protein
MKNVLFIKISLFASVDFNNFYFREISKSFFVHSSHAEFFIIIIISKQQHFHSSLFEKQLCDKRQYKLAFATVNFSSIFRLSTGSIQFNIVKYLCKHNFTMKGRVKYVDNRLHHRPTHTSTL